MRSSAAVPPPHAGGAGCGIRAEPRRAAELLGSTTEIKPGVSFLSTVRARTRHRSMLLFAAAAAVATATAAAAAPPAQLPPITIAPGVAMPAVSCGHPDDTASVNCTHGKGPGCAAVAGKMATMWLKLGGTGLDTAASYENQPQVGAAIRAAVAAGTNRSNIFVTTKINPGGRTGTGSCTAAATLAAVKADVSQLNIGALDLVLLHFPCSTDAGNKAVWEGLAQAKELGLTRAIGVSHFTASSLTAIMSVGKGAPAVNQCALSVGNHDDATIKFCKAKGIVYEAFSALKNVDLKDQRLMVRPHAQLSCHMALARFF
jgi:diketogulonate reductase-like aldo/keto reductase